MSQAPAACRSCGRGPLRPRSGREQAGVPHAGRGLCRPCRRVASADLGEFPPLGRGGVRTGRPAEDVAEDVADLLGAQPTGTLVGWSVQARRGAAYRLGIRRSTLDRALFRAAKRRDAA